MLADMNATVKATTDQNAVVRRAGARLPRLVADLRGINNVPFGTALAIEEVATELERIARAIKDVDSLHNALAGTVEMLHLALKRANRKADDAYRSALADLAVGAGKKHIDPTGYYVYLLWADDADRPLYIGQSTNILSRLGNHMQDPVKRERTRTVQLLRFNSPQEMAAREMELIKAYEPELNLQGIPGRRGSAA